LPNENTGESAGPEYQIMRIRPGISGHPFKNYISDIPEGLSMNWESPVSYTAKSMTRATRQILDELDVIYTRDSSYSSYSRFMVVMPLPDKLAYTYVFKLHHPHEFTIRYYDTKPGHSGVMPFMRIEGYEGKDREFITGILKRLLACFERPPWKFTTGMRLRHGYLLPEYRRARKAWASFDGLTLSDEEREKFREEMRESQDGEEDGSVGSEEGAAPPGKEERKARSGKSDTASSDATVEREGPP